MLQLVLTVDKSCTRKMIDLHDELYKEIDAVRQIPMLSTILDVICRITGMRFAAVARVTDCRWVACIVQDELNFGLEAGGELAIENTICSEIQHNHKAVIINDIENYDNFRHYQVLKSYGLQSYISFPIILKNGEFFGSLCAVDNRPAQLDDPKITGIFTLLTELLAFNLQSLAIMERSHSALKETSIQLSYTLDENMLYRQTPNYKIQEPLRKISLYSDLLISNTETAASDKAKSIAVKIHSLTKELVNKIDYANEISELATNASTFERVDLNNVLSTLLTQLGPKLFEKNIAVENDPLPSLWAVPVQMSQLLFHLLNFAIAFSKKDSPTDIHIRAKNHNGDDVKLAVLEGKKINSFELSVNLSGLEIDKTDVANVLAFFTNSSNVSGTQKHISGLAYCRKIVHTHGGAITAQVVPDAAVSFSIVLPLNYQLF